MENERENNLPLVDLMPRWLSITFWSDNPFLIISILLVCYTIKSRYLTFCRSQGSRLFFTAPLCPTPLRLSVANAVGDEPTAKSAVMSCVSSTLGVCFIHLISKRNASQINLLDALRLRHTRLEKFVPFGQIASAHGEFPLDAFSHPSHRCAAMPRCVT